MGPLVVVVFDPERDAGLRFFKVFKLCAFQKLRPDGLPVALDFSKGHRMMRRTANVMNTILLQFHLELGLAAPRNILPAVVAQEFLGYSVLNNRSTVNFQDVLAGLAAVNTEPDDVAAKIVDEADEVDLAPSHPPREDVGLPHLVGRGPFKEPGFRGIAFYFRANSWDEPLAVERFSDGFRTAREHEHSL